MKHAVLYIPGLGDRSLRNRRKIFYFWRYRNVSIDFAPMNWSVSESLIIKLDRISVQISELLSTGKAVSLIGESAGASAAMQLLRRHPELNAVILLCGKTQHPNRVSPRLLRSNPALKDSLDASDVICNSLSQDEKSKILNVHPIMDPVVPVSETKIPGVRNKLLPTSGHALSIALGGTLFSPILVSFIRSKGKRG